MFIVFYCAKNYQDTTKNLNQLVPKAEITTIQNTKLNKVFSPPQLKKYFSSNITNHFAKKKQYQYIILIIGIIFVVLLITLIILAFIKEWQHNWGELCGGQAISNDKL